MDTKSYGHMKRMERLEHLRQRKEMATQGNNLSLQEID